jgi:hypothetical protein
MPKKKPSKKKVKRQPKPMRRSPPDDVKPAPGVLNEGIPNVPQPAGMPSGLPKNVGHWNHPEEEEIK